MGVIITFLLSLYLLGLLARILLPWLLKVFVGNVMRSQGMDWGGESQGESEKKKGTNGRSSSFFGRRSEGLKVRRKEGQTLSDVLGGEYIEYEEV